MVTVVLAVMLIYRSMLETHEEDQIFLDSAEKSLAAEQQTVVARIERLTWPIRALFVLSGMLLVATVAVWLWNGLMSA